MSSHEASHRQERCVNHNNSTFQISSKTTVDLKAGLSKLNSHLTAGITYLGNAKHRGLRTSPNPYP